MAGKGFYNINDILASIDNLYQEIANLGTAAYEDAAVAFGVATLDAAGKLTYEQIPDSLLSTLTYISTWDASTNTPDLTTVDPSGNFYVVNVAGSRFGENWELGDWIISDGTNWQRVPSTQSVTSVQGRTGDVWIDLADVGLAGFDPADYMRLAFTETVTGSKTFTQTITGTITNAQNVSRTVTAGNGLTGGGELTANRTLSLGTPGTITGSSTNSTSGSSHTHAINISASDINAVPTTRQVIAGTGLVGGGALSSDVTLSLDPNSGFMTLDTSQQVNENAEKKFKSKTEFGSGTGYAIDHQGNLHFGSNGKPSTFGDTIGTGNGVDRGVWWSGTTNTASPPNKTYPYQNDYACLYNRREATAGGDNGSLTTNELWLLVGNSGVDKNSSGKVGFKFDAMTQEITVYGTLNIPSSNNVPTSRTITAGNGLTGGGDLTTNRTITLGTPGTITGSSTNSASSTSHTHAINISASDINAVPTSRTITAGNWMFGGGNLGGNITLDFGLDVNTWAYDSQGNARLYAGSTTSSSQFIIRASGTGSFQFRNSANNTVASITTGGTITGTAYAVSSDVRLKTDINPHPKVDKADIDAIRLITFKWLASKDVPEDLHGKEDSGVEAQAVQKVFPNCVYEVDGFLRVDYGKLAVHLILAESSED